MKDTHAYWVRREMSSREDCEGFQALICDEVYDASRTLCGSKRISSSASCLDFYNAMAGVNTNLENDPHDCYMGHLRKQTSNLPTLCSGLVLEPPTEDRPISFYLSIVSLVYCVVLTVVFAVWASRHPRNTAVVHRVATRLPPQVVIQNQQV